MEEEEGGKGVMLWVSISSRQYLIGSPCTDVPLSGTAVKPAVSAGLLCRWRLAPTHTYLCSRR